MGEGLGSVGPVGGWKHADSKGRQRGNSGNGKENLLRIQP